jgi:hypothetical protein
MALLGRASATVLAHGDTLDGPVVKDGRSALAAGDVTPVLKWVRPADEAEVRGTFASALRVRSGGGEARELADRLFFETVVRLHRQGEGAPFTGLKPAGHVEPAVALADHALDEGSATTLLEATTRSVSVGVKARFERVLAAKAHAGESVAAGREFVAAYVDYVHVLETILRVAGEGAAHDGAHEHDAVAHGHE